MSRSLFEMLVWECRLAVLEGLDESTLKDLLSNPEIHIAGVAYHKKAAEASRDPKIKARHMAQIKHHSREAERLRRGGKSSDEGAGDPDLHTKSVELLGRRGRFKPEDANRRDVEEYGSKGRGGVGAY